MAFKICFSNGARLRLIEINGVLFVVLKYRVQQTRHRPPNDKTSGLSSDTALYPHKYNNLHKFQMSNQIKTKREKNTFSQTSRLENPEELQLHHNHKKFLCMTVLLLFEQ
jgi:hypothetical protein